MPKVALDRQTETVESLISSYGCLGRNHVVMICNGDEEKARKIISFLIKYGATRTTEDEEILKPHISKLQRVDSGTLDCLTVAIDMARNEDDPDGVDLDSLKNSFENTPVKISMIDKENHYLNIVPVNENNATTTLAFIKDRFIKYHKKEKSAEGIVYVFVIKDKALLQTIGSIGIPFDHKIALVGNDGENNIKYFHPKTA